MRYLKVLGVLGVALGSYAFAAPPGPLDGSAILTDYNDSAELAVQTNRTGFGDQSFGSGAYSPGSEIDGLFLAKDDDFLYVGVTGNLERNGHAFIIFIDVDNFFFDGQTELRAEGVDGPPHTVQTASHEVVINTNGTPGDPTDDTWDYGSNGTILPCEADFAIAVDVYGGTMSVSEYSLFDPAGGAVGTWDPTPDNPNDGNADLYATRSFVGQGPINDGNDVMENQQDPDYGPAGFDDTNTSGVTDTDASLADAATSGLEIGIPLNLFQGENNLNIYVVLMDGSGSTGAVVNQMLPPLVDVGTAGPCDPPAWLGMRPDLTDTSLYVTSCRAVDVDTLPAFAGTAEGKIHPADYGVAQAQELQDCPTPYGDQHWNPGAQTYIGGSEIDAMYADNDAEFLYLGITGNLEPNGNQLNIFIDTDQGTGDAGTHGVPSIPWGGSIPGMAGDELPLGPKPDEHVVKYNYGYQLNLGGGPGPLYVDFIDLVNTTGVYRGSVPLTDYVTTDTLLTGGVNPNGMRVALNDTNEGGVPGCGDGEPCHELTAFEVESLARNTSLGFEIAIPLADLGLQDVTFPHEIKIWAYITGYTGWGSDQGLPSLRNVSGTGHQVQNAGGGPNNYTDPFNITQYRDFEGRAAIHVLYAPGDCDRDGDVDLDDFVDLAACLAGPGGGLSEGCNCFDLNGSGDVDLADFAVFQEAFTG